MKNSQVSLGKDLRMDLVQIDAVLQASDMRLGNQLAADHPSNYISTQDVVSLRSVIECELTAHLTCTWPFISLT